MDVQRDAAAPVSIFYSYAHEDEKLRQELEKHLGSLRREGLITEWHDRQIVAGTDWAYAIDAHLNTASVILLLISPDFIASDYCYSIEMQRAMERHLAGEVLVIPIILRPVDWQGTPFARLQCLPRDAIPVTNWDNQDEAFLDVATGIRRAIKHLKHSSDSIQQSLSWELDEPAARMILIPSGFFLYGEKDEQCYLESYLTDECLVTVIQYARFLQFIRETGNHSQCHPEEPEHKDHTPQDWQLQRILKLQHPVVGVDWFDAYAFAAWCGKELPSEQQWEKAARGECGQLYPWGNTFLEQHCNVLESGIGDTSEVRRFPDGRSSYGCYDMLGNVWEWTSSHLNEDNSQQILRGGAFNVVKNILKVTLYSSAPRSQRSKLIGFRCVRSVMSSILQK